MLGDGYETFFPDEFLIREIQFEKSRTPYVRCDGFQRDAMLLNLNKIQEHHMWHVTVFSERCNAPEVK